MAGGELVFVYVTQDCEMKCEEATSKTMSKLKVSDTSSLTQLSLPCALVLVALDAFLAVSFSSQSVQKSDRSQHPRRRLQTTGLSK
jgi:hypothetical protein